MVLTRSTRPRVTHGLEDRGDAPAALHNAVGKVSSLASRYPANAPSDSTMSVPHRVRAVLIALGPSIEITSALWLPNAR
jgi:hypothetical protein